MNPVIAMKSVREMKPIEWTIQKSRFIGFLLPVQSLAEVSRILDSIRAEHPLATHVCSAYILSSPDAIEKANDDGEPQKTAGIPMLEILKKNNLTNVLAVAVRYFGGIKLGAGGLIRAYAKTIRLCVENAVFSYPVSMDICRVHLDFSHSGAIVTYLRNVSRIIDEKYELDAIVEFEIHTDQREQISEEIKKRTSSDRPIEILRSFTVFQ